MSTRRKDNKDPLAIVVKELKTNIEPETDVNPVMNCIASSSKEGLQYHDMEK